MFLTLQWIDKVFQLYQEKGLLILKNKSIQFTPKLFLATLLQIYIIPLWEKVALNFFPEFSEEEEELMEKSFSYLLAQDLLSIEFSQWYRENLLGREYSFYGYLELALEFLKIKEQIKQQIQIPLLDELKKLCMDVEENLEGGNKISERQKKRLQRLYTFFKIIEKFSPSLTFSLVERAEALVLRLKGEKLEKEALDWEEAKKKIEGKFEEELQKLIKRSKI